MQKAHSGSYVTTDGVNLFKVIKRCTRQKRPCWLVIGEDGQEVALPLADCTVTFPSIRAYKRLVNTSYGEGEEVEVYCRVGRMPARWMVGWTYVEESPKRHHHIVLNPRNQKRVIYCEYLRKKRK